ncbi:L-methionine gamma-lyase [termite gut metagenome]|uniref:L-methionine gamma-lyase n=1 Tax=termite gut metagenome TaxID=433724 RepID=A0A5J4S3G6_9ZZZZ
MSNNIKKQRFDTLLTHAGYQPGEHNHSIQVPIYQTTAFDLESPERADRLATFEELGYMYSRMSNPTLAALESRVSALDGGVVGVAVGSGMAAVTNAILNAAEGGRLLAAGQIYGGTYDAYKRIYPRLNVQVDIVDDINNLEAVEKAIQADTKAIFIESITNPTVAITDIEAIAKLAHKNGLPLIVDNSLATPYLLNPIQYGADVVVYSATKALSGHGSVIGGLVIDAGKFDWTTSRHPQFTDDIPIMIGKSFAEAFPQFPFAGRLRINYLVQLGAVLGPFDAYLILQGIETLSERLKKQSESALKVAQFLSSHPKVSTVNYSALPDSKYHALAEKYLPKGAGGILSFGYKGDDEGIYKFINALKLFSFHPNLGDARSLIINSPKTTHKELTHEEQARVGIFPELIRLSIGLEDADDLIEDLKQALEVNN